MAFDPMPAGGSGPHGPFCASCNEPIAKGERSVRIHFNNDPHGHRGLSGLYHEQCGKPFASLAHVVNVTSFKPF
ncbi:hypothetical protein [Pseudorhodoplanes sp.]|uniref:hypothetical protein n=1 Tax=Pseudorhodoplanes sp. TaxID=1934341 RepID=UPI002CDA0DEF|nr:hypothetical protein [Pseudorhodoplanes sp.]HWV51004.1 hypothetical protein [Pseudorhodoplanes sp.]